MAASKGGIIGKCVLLLLAMVLLVVVMASDSSLYTTESTDPTKGEVGLSDERHMGIGLFKDSAGQSLPSGFSSWRSVGLDKKLIAKLVQMGHGVDVGCENFAHLWRGMQAAAIIALIGMFISLIVTLTYCGNQDEKTARNCCSCLADVMALLGGSAFIILMVVCMKVSPCSGDWKTNTEDDVFGTAAGSLDVMYDLAFGIYLASFSFLFAAISLCVGLVAKRGGGGDSRNNQSYQEMDRK